MNTKNEVMAIAELSFDLNAAGKQIHCNIDPSGVSVTKFNEDHRIEWQQNLYEWEINEAYLPKLRLLRHELEQMLARVKSVNEQEAA